MEVVQYWADPIRAREDPASWDIRGAVLPKLDVAQLDRVCAKYSGYTGVSWEGFNPRWVLGLSLGLKQRLLLSSRGAGLGNRVNLDLKVSTLITAINFLYQR